MGIFVARTASLGVPLLVALCLAIEPRAAQGDPLAPGEGATELTRQGQVHVREGDEELGIRRFVDALQLDPGYGPAYLELGKARERRGDLDEAERTYDLAIERLPTFVAAYRARATLKRRKGDPAGEISDLETVAKIEPSPETLRELAARYVEGKAWPAALSIWRRLAEMEETQRDDAARHEATTTTRALTMLCDELDPVAAGRTGRGWVRRSLANIARRK